MALTVAQLLGSPADGSDLDRNLEIGVKATGVGTAVAPGRVVFLTESSGEWAIATDGSTGRQGVVPKLDPLNVDGDDTITVATGINSAWYIEANGTIKPGARAQPSAGGTLKQYVAGNVGTTVAENDVEAAIKDFERAPWVYEGHYGEGSGLGNKPTQILDNEIGRFRIAK
jgi:hypothetical protein